MAPNIAAHWTALAEREAQDAFENFIHIPMQVKVIPEIGVAYRDNNPFGILGNASPRKEFIQRIRTFLGESNLMERACAHWPQSGDAKNYTFVMLIDADAAKADFISDGVTLALIEVKRDLAKRASAARARKPAGKKGKK
jgi:hypothetical protein